MGVSAWGGCLRNVPDEDAPNMKSGEVHAIVYSCVQAAPMLVGSASPSPKNRASLLLFSRSTVTTTAPFSLMAHLPIEGVSGVEAALLSACLGPELHAVTKPTARKNNPLR